MVEKQQPRLLQPPWHPQSPVPTCATVPSHKVTQPFSPT